MAFATSSRLFGEIRSSSADTTRFNIASFRSATFLDVGEAATGAVT
jgi:hypothetical protein